MAINNKIRGGAGSDHHSGRMDYPYAGNGSPAFTKSQETHSLAHADGFIGPRVGEVYGQTGGVTNSYPNHPNMVPSSVPGYKQPNSSVNADATNGQTSSYTGVGARQALTDNGHGMGKSRVYQHKGSGNFIETYGDRSDRVNDYGTTATGQVNDTRGDFNFRDSNGNVPKASEVASDTENYTDVTNKVRASDTYKAARLPGTRR